MKPSVVFPQQTGGVPYDIEISGLTSNTITAAQFGSITKSFLKYSLGDPRNCTGRTASLSCPLDVLTTGSDNSFTQLYIEISTAATDQPAQRIPPQ